MNYSEIPKTPFLTKDRLKELGFTVIDQPIVQIGNKVYPAKSNRLISVEATTQIDENEVVNMLNELGWKHILEVSKYEIKLLDSDSLMPKDHVQILARGF